jgi:hypothetical protein
MKASPDLTVATFPTSQRTEVRVVISDWRGQRKLRFQEFTPGPIAGSMWRSGNGVSLGVEHLAALVDALQKAEAEARKRGSSPLRGS